MGVTYYNPNPNCKFFKSGKPKNWSVNDSAVRSICKILNVDWSVAYKILCTVGKDMYDIPISKNVINKVLEDNNFEFITFGKPKKEANRLTVKEFVEQNNLGTYVLNLADYFITVINGEIFDVSDICMKKSVYSYWKKKL